MTLLFDKHRIVSPALAPSQLREADEFGGRQDADADAHDRPCQQYAGRGAAGDRTPVHAPADGSRRQHPHPLPLLLAAVGAAGRSRRRWRIDQQYTDIADLGRLQIDGLIVTGAEPNAATLQEEPFWQDLTDIIDWARTNTRSTIWSCLAAHAAVLHLDGIERQRLDAKCSGVFDCAKVTDGWLTSDVSSPLKIAHSRLNELRESDLVARGYQILTASQEAGVDIFTKQFDSQFVFFQGHPEYDALSLQREYLRDITRFLAGERDSYPACPAGYFDIDDRTQACKFPEARAAPNAGFR